MSDKAPESHRVNVHAVDVRPTSSVEAGRRRVGNRRNAGVPPCGRNAFRRVARRPGWRIYLEWMMKLDDLGRLVVARGLLCERHHEHRTDTEVGRDHGADIRSLFEPRRDRRQSIGVEARGTNDDVLDLTDAGLN